MSRDWLSSILSRLRAREAEREPGGGLGARHLVFDVQPELIYAVGDLHGRLDLMRQMEAAIIADAEGAAALPWVILLGDLVDRGPETAALIDHVMSAPPPGMRRIVLGGNHEALMLDAMDDPRALGDWIDMGGRETLISYGVSSGLFDRGRADLKAVRAAIAACVPDDHLDYLASRPLVVETPEAIFVHAGLMPGRPLEAQRADDLIWYRDKFDADYSEFGRVVVHGHTIVREPLVTSFRIDVDTGAVGTGRLTAVRIAPASPPVILTVTGARS
jgi:serine/threonine protein phosphatase 1